MEKLVYLLWSERPAGQHADDPLRDRLLSTLPEGLAANAASRVKISVTDAAVDKILAMPKLESLTFKDNGSVTDEALKKLSSKEWEKLDTGK